MGRPANLDLIDCSFRASLKALLTLWEDVGSRFGGLSLRSESRETLKRPNQ